MRWVTTTLRPRAVWDGDRGYTPPGMRHLPTAQVAPRPVRNVGTLHPVSVTGLATRTVAPRPFYVTDIGTDEETTELDAANYEV